MYSKYLVVYGIIIQSLILNVTYCLRLDKTGWRTINVNVEKFPQTTTTTTRPTTIIYPYESLINHNYRATKNQITARTNTDNNLKQKEFENDNNNKNIINKKLVQWDDDDINNFNLSNDNLLKIPRRNENIENNLKNVNKFLENRLISDKGFILKNTDRRRNNFNRLIYHGQIKQNNNVKLIDGIKLVINTHEAVPINRRSSSNKISSYNNAKFINNNLLVGWAPDNEQYVTNNEDKLPSNVSISFTNNVDNKKISIKKKNSNYGNKVESDELAKYSLISSSSSDWKPITVSQAQRQRRSRQQQSSKSKMQKLDEEEIERQQFKESSLSSNKDNKSLEIPTIDNKWKPINITTISKVKTDDDEKSKRINKDDSIKKSSFSKLNKEIVDDAAPKENIVYGKKLINNQRGHHHLTINEPFDEDDGILKARIYNKSDLLKNHQPEEYLNDDEYLTNISHQFDKRSQSIEVNYKPASEKNSTIIVDNNKIDNKWVPLDRTTSKNDDLDTQERITITTTSTTESTPITSLPGNSSANNGTNSSIVEPAAHRSASDLNYIYSSQPQQQQEVFRQPTTSGGSYYSNYLIQQQPQQSVIEQPQQPATLIDQPAIIDTTSGQVPEMIADRVPDSAPISTLTGSDSSYSMPQTSPSFQPAQAPPIRVPLAYTNSYPTDNHYYQQQQQQQAQPIRVPPQPIVSQQQHSAYNYNSNQQQSVQTTSAPQVVRQEHHYHYYNQQAQQPQRSINNNILQQDRSVQQQQQPVQSVIREVQPVFISQPIIQQQTSTTTTTPAPQIIREIIKEVPVQSIQMPTRFIMQTPAPPIALPASVMFQFQRDQSLPIDGTAGLMQTYAASLASPAQRVIRQISNSIPSVAVRIPPVVVPPIRLPTTIQQAFQLPVRLASSSNNQQQSITRQTASFVIPPMPKKTTTYLTETQAMPTHTTIMHTTQFTPATRTTVYTTDHQQPSTNQAIVGSSSGAYSSRK